jgi:hypothetical protein
LKKGHYELVTTSIYLDLIGKIPKILWSNYHNTKLNRRIPRIVMVFIVFLVGLVAIVSVGTDVDVVPGCK